MITTTVTRSGTLPKVIAERLEPAMLAGVRYVTAQGEKIARERIERIYRRKIPTVGQQQDYELGFGKRKRSKGINYRSYPLWTRTGKLREGLLANVSPWKRNPTGFIYVSSFVKYAHDNKGNRWRGRHGLGHSWTPKNPALGIVRRNPWYAETARELEPRIVNTFDSGFKSVMNK